MVETGRDKILEVISLFTGLNNEPSNNIESYILRSMWVMMMSEFEASIKSTVESYIDLIKTKDINDIHICLLIKNFHGTADGLSLNKIVGMYKKKARDITYHRFTQDRVPKYKTKSVITLFESLGFFLNDEVRNELLILDSLGSTRDSIAHGDIGISITCAELTENLTKLVNISKMLNLTLNKSLTFPHSA